MSDVEDRAQLSTCLTSQITSEGLPVRAIEPVVIPITEEHHIARARRAAMALAKGTGFRRTRALYIATAVTELASNLFFHTPRGGSVTMAPVEHGGEFGVEVIAEDDGPGIEEVDRAMQDGFTTGGGLGGGLPGVKRLMDEFEITSTVGVGTRIVTRKWQTCR